MGIASRRVTISALGGGHARPVAELVRLAVAYEHPVTIRTSAGAEADLGSVLAVMTLGVSEGDVVTLETADAPASAALLDSLAAVLDPPR
ncbi:MAG: HPr family phosphocarrier protein [Microbacterium sp.]